MSSLFLELDIYDKIYDYCKVNGEYRELDQLIATSGAYSFFYAKIVMGGRFKLGEEIIATDEIRWNWYQKFMDSL